MGRGAEQRAGASRQPFQPNWEGFRLDAGGTAQQPARRANKLQALRVGLALTTALTSASALIASLDACGDQSPTPTISTPDNRPQDITVSIGNLPRLNAPLGSTIHLTTDTQDAGIKMQYASDANNNLLPLNVVYSDGSHLITTTGAGVVLFEHDRNNSLIGQPIDIFVTDPALIGRLENDLVSQNSNFFQLLAGMKLELINISSTTVATPTSGVSVQSGHGSALLMTGLSYDAPTARETAPSAFQQPL